MPCNQHRVFGVVPAALVLFALVVVATMSAEIAAPGGPNLVFSTVDSGGGMSSGGTDLSTARKQ